MTMDDIEIMIMARIRDNIPDNIAKAHSRYNSKKISDASNDSSLYDALTKVFDVEMTKDNGIKYIYKFKYPEDLSKRTELIEYINDIITNIYDRYPIKELSGTGSLSKGKYVLNHKDIRILSVSIHKDVLTLSILKMVETSEIDDVIRKLLMMGV